ncbi:MAG TPA: transcription termination factor NusA [Candidatus Nitrosotalea sp.]|nr:transcription termination factor NusA [Candidatus Nitrosotalea sp.]
MSRAGSRSPSEPSTESLGEALTALCAEVGIPFEEMLHTVESALAVAYVRAFNPTGFVTVKLDTKTGALDVRSRTVRPDGAEMIESLPSEPFKRMAAQTAKHAVLRYIHDLEREKVMRDVAEHKGELASGVVDRIEAGTVFVDLGRIEGVMPPEEQIPGEQLHPGKPVLVVILDAQRNPRQAQVRVSRGARSFVHRLLEAEVPEIKAGTVQIKSIAREPGLRTKVAVASTEPGLDPVGACVGPKGVRHRAILSELGNEHVDIVPWSDDAEAFVASSLGPAKAEGVSIDRGTRTATVLVPRGQLSLAIGRDGQNARLAAKLTGFRIDIKPSEADDEATP